MYLDYRIHIIDDDYGDRNDGDEVEELKSKLEKTIADKGLHPIVRVFTSIDEAKDNLNERIDYFLSDENLGGSNSGANFYHELRTSYQSAFCDFILYTRNNKTQIIERQLAELSDKQDPNLFSRFSFVARDLNHKWIDELIDIIEHSLSKREQMNTLRAIFAHETSKMHAALRNKFILPNDATFAAAIRSVTDVVLNNNLTEIRHLRNGLVHNNEAQDVHGNFYIPYSSTTDAFNVYSLKFDLSQSANFLSKLKNVKTDLRIKLGLIIN